MITWIQFFGGLPPLRMWEGKNRLKFAAILRNFTLRSRIFPEHMKISTSGKRRYQLESLRRSAKKLVNFGPLTTELTRLMFTDPNSTSLKGYISAPRGRCRLKFFFACATE